MDWNTQNMRMFSHPGQGDPSVFSVLHSVYWWAGHFKLSLLFPKQSNDCKRSERSSPNLRRESDTGVNTGSALFWWTNIAGEAEGNTGNSLVCQCCFCTMGTQFNFPLNPRGFGECLWKLPLYRTHFITTALWKIRLSQWGVTHFNSFYLGHTDINMRTCLHKLESL